MTRLKALLLDLFAPVEHKTYDPERDDHVRNLRLVRHRSEKAVRDFSRGGKARVQVDGLYNRVDVPVIRGRDRHGR
jgi:hypothetical protein